MSMSGNAGRDLPWEIERALRDENLQRALQAFAQTVGLLRQQGLRSLPDYPELRERARAIKADVIAHLDEYLAQLQRHVEARGGRVFYAQDAREARDFVIQFVRERGARLIVKAKSMTSEEIKLREALEEAGFTVVETDLGERIVQLADERPSHLIGPAIHKTLDEVRALFERWLGPDPDVEIPKDPQGLTALARRALREVFFNADVGITGVNFAVAETGHLVLVENEGNVRLTARLPETRVALMGLEKLVPTLDDLLVMLKLLPRSGTGQKLTSYVSLLAPEGLQLVVLDNGRARLRQDPELEEALFCVRCGACLDTCPTYRAVGGHVFGGATYMGGIGAAWTWAVEGPEAAWAFHELCVGCGRCTEVCPVQIDIPWLNDVLKARRVERLGATPLERLLGRPDRLAANVEKLPAPLVQLLRRAGRPLLGALGLDPERPWPRPKTPFTRTWTLRAQAGARTGAQEDQRERVALFVDCFTNHFEPEVLRAAVDLLERLGFAVELADNVCCGRAALSQGLLDEARRLAQENARRLGRRLEAGVPIVGVEPSCLTALRHEYARLLPERSALIEKLKAQTFEALEFLALRRREGRLRWPAAERGHPERPPSRRIVYHGHCQQKAFGRHRDAVELLRAVPGLDVQIVEVPCCGMAGAFGYKRPFAELSRHIGRKLIEQMEQHGGEPVAPGFSCRAQIRDLMGRDAKHPVQIVAELLSQ